MVDAARSAPCRAGSPSMHTVARVSITLSSCANHRLHRRRLADDVVELDLLLLALEVHVLRRVIAPRRPAAAARASRCRSRERLRGEQQRDLESPRRTSRTRALSAWISPITSSPRHSGTARIDRIWPPRSTRFDSASCAFAVSTAARSLRTRRSTARLRAPDPHPRAGARSRDARGTRRARTDPCRPRAQQDRDVGRPVEQLERRADARSITSPGSSRSERPAAPCRRAGRPAGAALD